VKSKHCLRLCGLDTPECLHAFIHKITNSVEDTQEPTKIAIFHVPGHPALCGKPYLYHMLLRHARRALDGRVLGGEKAESETAIETKMSNQGGG